MSKPLPSAEVLRSLLEYDPTTGDLTWKARKAADLGWSEGRCRAWNEQYAGTPALAHVGSHGYRTGTLIGLGGVKAHRVIWKMAFDTDPRFIDHLNGIRTDNRLANLRDVSRAENARNPGLSVNNTSGANGVYWYPRYGKWMASIRVNGRRKNLGYFQDKAAAISARRDADAAAGYSTWRDR